MFILCYIILFIFVYQRALIQIFNAIFLALLNVDFKDF